MSFDPKAVEQFMRGMIEKQTGDNGGINPAGWRTIAQVDVEQAILKRTAGRFLVCPLGVHRRSSQIEEISYEPMA